MLSRHQLQAPNAMPHADRCSHPALTETRSRGGPTSVSGVGLSHRCRTCRRAPTSTSVPTCQLSIFGGGRSARFAGSTTSTMSQSTARSLRESTSCIRAPGLWSVGLTVDTLRRSRRWRGIRRLISSLLPQTLILPRNEHSFLHIRAASWRPRAQRMHT